MTYIIKDVLEAEKKAEEIIKRAQEKKSKLIEEARHSALSYISEKEKEIDAAQDAAVKEKQKAIDSKKQAIIAEGMKKAAEIEAESRKNFAQAKEFVVKEFERIIS